MVIEDKELGIKIPENTDQQFWLDFKEKRLKDNSNSEKEIIIGNNLIKLADEEIAKCQKK